MRPALAFGDQALRVTASIGLAIYPDHATEPALLLRHADHAMYRVKAGGKDAIALFA